MKGPHFFEKRKKEMARQEKLKQKAERKAQRKAEKDRGEGGEAPDGEASDDIDEVAAFPGDSAEASAPASGEATGSGTSPEDAPGMAHRSPRKP